MAGRLSRHQPVTTALAAPRAHRLGTPGGPGKRRAGKVQHGCRLHGGLLELALRTGERDDRSAAPVSEK
jgi:hypothetical protein